MYFVFLVLLLLVCTIFMPLYFTLYRAVYRIDNSQKSWNSLYYLHMPYIFICYVRVYRRVYSFLHSDFSGFLFLSFFLHVCLFIFYMLIVEPSVFLQFYSIFSFLSSAISIFFPWFLHYTLNMSVLINITINSKMLFVFGEVKKKKYSHNSTIFVCFVCFTILKISTEISKKKIFFGV